MLLMLVYTAGIVCSIYKEGRNGPKPKLETDRMEITLECIAATQEKNMPLQHKEEANQCTPNTTCFYDTI